MKRKICNNFITGSKSDQSILEAAFWRIPLIFCRAPNEFQALPFIKKNIPYLKFVNLIFRISKIHL